MKFEYNKPFKTIDNEIVTMKSRVLIHDVELIEVHENKRRYTTDQLTPISQEEYQAYYFDDMDEYVCGNFR